MHNSIYRFSDRVNNYIKYRPSYPKEIIPFLEKLTGLKKEHVIADIGSGTGISAQLFLENGNQVLCIEPNKEMREAAEKMLNHYHNFKSLDTIAEDTRLPSSSVDFVVAAQAFHWFNIEKSKAEFKRILRKEGFVLLIWNDRVTDSTGFSIEYEALLNQYGTDYKEVNHKNINKEILESFYDSNFREETFKNEQAFDFNGLKGRLMSSSYAPAESSADHKLMMTDLEKIFNKYQKGGFVKMEYDTRLFYGKL